MAIPVQGRLWGRRTAPFHVQLELSPMRARERASGETQVRGLVVRAFRTDGRLGLGDRVEFPLWVCRRGDEPTGPAFIYEEAFSRAEYIEAYLTGTPPECQLVAYEFRVLEALTDRPALTADELEEREPASVADRRDANQVSRRRAWQFWKGQDGA